MMGKSWKFQVLSQPGKRDRLKPGLHTSEGISHLETKCFQLLRSPAGMRPRRSNCQTVKNPLSSSIKFANFQGLPFTCL
jgi:hypothetical protein